MFYVNNFFLYFGYFIVMIFTIDQKCLNSMICFGRKHLKYQKKTENLFLTELMLSQKLPVVRSVDIANELGYKKSSISIAMKT